VNNELCALVLLRVSFSFALCVVASSVGLLSMLKAVSDCDAESSVRCCVVSRLWSRAASFEVSC
jgi:hypothetical protein